MGTEIFLLFREKEVKWEENYYSTKMGVVSYGP
jgi:hypothetical protein